MASSGTLHLTFADVSRKAGPGVAGKIMYAQGTPNLASAGEETVSPTEPATEAPIPSPTNTGSASIQPDPDFQRNLTEGFFSTRGWSTDFSLHSVPYNEFISGGPPKDGIASIDNPKFISPEDSRDWLFDPQPVIALEVNGDARAYPIQILVQHEIANDVIGGIPVAVTFCPLCNSAIAFDRRLDGVTHEFGVSGILRNSDLIMYDRTTESWWQQFTGEAVVGELVGKKLTLMPASIISWGDFKAGFPDGTVLSRDTGFFRDYDRLPYAGYDRADESPFLFIEVENGQLRLKDTDGRLLPKERVIALSVDGVDAAFPFSILSRERVANNQIGNQDVVVLFKRGTLSAFVDLLVGAPTEIGASGVFDPHVDGTKLTFRREGETFVDDQTGSVWDITGGAVEGPLAGKRMDPIVHGDHFWFAWGAFKPDTLIYQGAG